MQDKRGMEDSPRREQKAISGRKRRQETAALEVFPPGFTLLFSLLLRSHEARTCTDKAGVREKG